MTEPKRTIELPVPCEFRETDKCFFVQGMTLPKSEVVLQLDAQGKVVSMIMPEWLAAKEGLVDSLADAGTVEESMCRSDWYLLGATMAFLIRGESSDDAVWEARKVVAKMEKGEF